MLKRVVVSIYLHPEYFPPTINAINSLAEICQELVVVTNNNSKDDFFIGKNIRFKKLGECISPIEFEQKSLAYKILFFLKFTLTFFKYSRSKKTDLILMYDSVPLFSFFLFRKLLKKKTISWFHSHDMPMRDKLKKYSIGWFSAEYELKALQKVSIFSLPTDDRLKYYPNINPNTKYFELPNFPSQKIYNNSLKEDRKSTNDKLIKIIYQGTIGWGHSIEEIVTLLESKINGKTLHLTLKGKVKSDYKDAIDKLADLHNVSDKLSWIGVGPYKTVQNITKENHIGIAIHLGDIPQGTASNKIYEYAACGLPALVYDNEQFNRHLGGYKWAVFTDGSVESLRKAIEYCDNNFDELSKSAIEDFNSLFFFEKDFNKIKHFLLLNNN
jgi:hypothetical protein